MVTPAFFDGALVPAWPRIMSGFVVDGALDHLWCGSRAALFNALDRE